MRSFSSYLSQDSRRHARVAWGRAIQLYGARTTVAESQRVAKSMFRVLENANQSMRGREPRGCGGVHAHRAHMVYKACWVMFGVAKLS